MPPCRLFTTPAANAANLTSPGGFSGAIRRKAIPIDEVCNVLVKSSKVEISFGASPVCPLKAACIAYR